MYQNKVTLIGFLGSDAEVRTNDNRSFTTLSLATKSSYKKDGKYISHTEWHRCVVFGKLAEFAGTLKKGASPGRRRAAQPRIRQQEGWHEANHLGNPAELGSQAGPGREGQPGRAGARRHQHRGDGGISRPSSLAEARSSLGFLPCGVLRHEL
jgi:single-stranded DNA-binding protein